MRVCPRCHFYNQDKNKRCLKCGCVLQHDEEMPKRKPGAKKELPERFSSFFRKRFYRVKNLVSSEIPDAPHRFPYVAAGLSLVLGAGQIYNKQYKKAFFFLVGHFIALFIVIATITNPYSNWIILGYAAYLLFAYNDGLVTAFRINGQEWRWVYSLAAFFGLFFVLGLGFTLSQFFFLPMFKLVMVMNPSLEPMFERLDLVYVDKLNYYFRDPRVGEIVYYNPDKFIVEIPGGLESTRIVVHEKQTFERVMGAPGDLIERKDGKFFRNGNPMPPWMKPMLPDNVFEDMKFKVPEDKWLVIYSHSPRDEFIEMLDIGAARPSGVPPLNAPGIILEGWEDACLVDKDQIIGVALFIANPPPRRRFLLPP